MASGLLDKNTYEDAVRRMDREAEAKTGLGVIHWLTLGSIAASLGLYLAGRRNLAMFVGLWPPTLMAVKTAAEARKTRGPDNYALLG